MATRVQLLLFIVMILHAGPVAATESESGHGSQPGHEQPGHEQADARSVANVDPTTEPEVSAPENLLEDFEPVPEPEPEPDPDPEPEPEPDPEPEPEPEPAGILDRRDVVAFYGHPFSTGMGILGENSIEENAERLRELAAEYDRFNGDRGVIPGFHIIYATATVEADVGILQRAKLMEYIRFAEENEFIIILDHQIGRHDVVSSVETMFELLHYDSVHLAFDPEWSTDRPNEVIGSVTAEEINEVQRSMQEYMIEHDIEGRKMLLVHQFNWRMIEDREQVRGDFERIDLVHNADGFGPPDDKRASWEYNTRATNMPLKGFKLFLPKSWRDGGYDDPLMTPEEVFSLEPRPVVIQYQ
ncbi:MAG: hypothetical protein ACLFPO_10135 [Spirochaetaceae bacterium]